MRDLIAQFDLGRFIVFREKFGEEEIGFVDDFFGGLRHERGESVFGLMHIVLYGLLDVLEMFFFGFD